MKRSKILTKFMIIVTTLFLLSGCTPIENFGELLISDGLSQTTLSPSEPWPLPDVEISDYGRQVAEEFLAQFESLFLMHLREYAEEPFWSGWETYNRTEIPPLADLKEDIRKSVMEQFFPVDTINKDISNNLILGTPAPFLGFTYTDGVRYYIPFDEDMQYGGLTLHKKLAFTFSE